MISKCKNIYLFFKPKFWFLYVSFASQIEFCLNVLDTLQWCIFPCMYHRLCYVIVIQIDTTLDWTINNVYEKLFCIICCVPFRVVNAADSLRMRFIWSETWTHRNKRCNHKIWASLTRTNVKLMKWLPLQIAEILQWKKPIVSDGSTDDVIRFTLFTNT